MTPTSISEIKKILAILALSPNNSIPTITEPTAPIPVQTGYAMLSGIVLREEDRSHMLIKSVSAKRAVGIIWVKPLECLRKIAQTTSKIPAVISKIQLSVGEFIR